MLFLVCPTSQRRIRGRIIACCRAIAISSKKVYVFTSGKLKIWFWLSRVFFWSFEWKGLHFFIEFIDLLFDWLNLFLSFFLFWFQGVLYLNLYVVIFLAHKGLQSWCSCPLIYKRGEAIELLIASFSEDDWRRHFWSLKGLISKIEVSVLCILVSWLNYFYHWIRLLLNEPSQTLEFAESSRLESLLAVSWRLDHGRKDYSVFLFLVGHQECRLLIGSKMRLLRVHVVEIDLLRLWLLLLFSGIIGIHKY